MNLLIILMIVVLMIAAFVLANHKSKSDQDLTELKKYLSPNRKTSNTPA